jgi:hypothetical protein
MNSLVLAAKMRGLEMLPWCPDDGFEMRTDYGTSAESEDGKLRVAIVLDSRFINKNRKRIGPDLDAFSALYDWSRYYHPALASPNIPGTEARPSVAARQALPLAIHLKRLAMVRRRADGGVDSAFPAAPPTRWCGVQRPAIPPRAGRFFVEVFGGDLPADITGAGNVSV